MDTIADILSRKDYDEPQESIIIKRYIDEHYNISVSVRVQPRVIVIYARSAALVSTLRMQTYQLQQACQTDKKIVFRIA